MHRALTIAELQGIIIDYVLVDESVGTSTVAALARTCRTLHETAARALWHELPSLTPLLYCLPGDLLQKETTHLDFTRSLRASDWSRVHEYASHINTLHFQSTWKRHGRSRFPTISPAAFIALTEFIPVDCLMPNLRALTWDPPYGEDASMFSFVEKLLSRTLTSLTLRVLTDAQVPAPRLLRSLPSRCPSMQSLVVEYEGTNKDVSEAIAECMSHLTQLRECEVYIPALNIALNHLAMLPNLQSLTAWQCPSLPAYPRAQLLLPISPSLPCTFAALHEISVRTEQITTCITLIQLLSSHEIKSITFTYSEWASATLLAECNRAISEHCNHTSLTVLSIAFDRDAGTPYGISDAIVDDTVLRPLLVFSDLEALELDPYCSFAIDDRLIDDVAVCWPRLRSLELIPKKALVNTSSVTLNGLIPLIKNCPSIRTLCLPLEDHVTEPSLEAAQTLHNENITSLVVISTTIEDPAAVILFLVHLFPKLQVIDNWAEGEDEEEESANPWQVIETMVKGINSAFPRETRGKEGRLTIGQLSRLMRKWMKGFSS